MTGKGGKIKAEHMEEDQGEVYRVEKILEKRTRNRKVEYKVKWEGYSEAECTWEPAKNILCRQLLRDFEANEHPGGKTTAERKKATRRPTVSQPASAVSSEQILRFFFLCPE